MTRLTIEDILREHSLVSGDPPEGELSLLNALVSREEERVGLLAQIAARFGVHPPIFAKVILDLELGMPKSPEEAAYITTQYEQHWATMVRQVERINGLPEGSLTERLPVPSTDIEGESEGGIS